MNKSAVKVIGALKREGKFASAQTLYQSLRKSGESTGLATVEQMKEKPYIACVKLGITII